MFDNLFGGRGRAKALNCIKSYIYKYILIIKLLTLIFFLRSSCRPSCPPLLGFILCLALTNSIRCTATNLKSRALNAIALAKCYSIAYLRGFFLSYRLANNNRTIIPCLCVSLSNTAL